MSSLHDEYKDLLKDALLLCKNKREKVLIREEEHTFFSKEKLKQKLTLQAPSLLPINPTPSYAAKATDTKTTPAKEEPKAELSKPVVPTIKKEEPKLPSIYEELSPKVQQVFPHLKIIKDIPSDAIARRNAKLYEKFKITASVILLCRSKDPQEEKFLDNIATAISSRLGLVEKIDVTLLEKENMVALMQEAKPKLILATKEVLLFPFIRPHVKKETSANNLSFANIPLICLEAFAKYSADPLLKKELWNRICQMLQPLSTPAS